METENQYLYIDTEPKPWDKAKNVISVTETGITFYIMYMHMRNDISKTSLFFSNNINIILALLFAYTYNVIFDRLDRIILIINSDTC